MTYQNYQRRELLKTAAICSTILGGILLITIGYVCLLNSANAKIEANCTAQGGQALVTPGQPTQCLLPAH